MKSNYKKEIYKLLNKDHNTNLDLFDLTQFCKDKKIYIYYSYNNILQIWEDLINLDFDYLNNQSEEIFKLIFDSLVKYRELNDTFSKKWLRPDIKIINLNMEIDSLLLVKKKLIKNFVEELTKNIRYRRNLLFNYKKRIEKEE